MDTVKKIETFKDYFKKNPTQIHLTYASLDFREFAKIDYELAEELLNNPEDILEMIEIAIFDLKDKKIQIKIINLPNTEERNINKIRKNDLGKLIFLKGIIITRTKVFPRVVSVKFECPACGAIFNIKQGLGAIKSPKKCGCGRKGMFNIIETELKDTLYFKIEELPERLIGSEASNNIQAIIEGSMCQKDYRIILGARIEAIGYLKENSIQTKTHATSVNCDYLFKVLDYKNMDDMDFSKIVSKEEQLLFDKIKRQKNPAKFISKLIMSDIHGYNSAKEAVIYQQFGGTMWGNPPKRDFIHVLLFGSPGTAKTDICMRAAQLNPVHRITMGMGVSAVGITATVKKDELTGNFVLVGGLLPRCSGGVVFIDEMDKMGENELKMMHTPIESGFCAINKAGIDAKMLTKTAILATSNPKINAEKVSSKPLKVYDLCSIPHTLLDRMDIICSFSDVPNAKSDGIIADTLIERAKRKGNFDNRLDTNTNISIQNKNTFEWNGYTYYLLTLQKYIYICKSYIPSFSIRGRISLKRWYVSLRALAEGYNFTQKKPTPRVVESILRLARAISRAKMKDTITIHELKLAMSYFDFMFDINKNPKIIEEEI